MKQPLTFDTLREANMARIPRFRGPSGTFYHQPDGSDWSLAEWGEATLGELGELANVLKKVRRGDFSLEHAMPMIRREFADVLIYLDIYAYQLRIDLGEAVREKFNEVSHRVDAGVFILADNSITVGRR